MMRKTIKLSLDAKEINTLANKLREYANSLPSKADIFIQRLAEKGIEVAKVNTPNGFYDVIEYRFETEGIGSGKLIGRNTKLIHRVWYNKNGEMQGEADISPILMAEFGAGVYADDGHRGTFPGQKNAFRDVFAWYDSEGNKHFSTEDVLMRPTHPMHNAYEEMMSQIKSIAEEVFAYE